MILSWFVFRALVRRTSHAAEGKDKTNFATMEIFIAWTSPFVSQEGQYILGISLLHQCKMI